MTKYREFHGAGIPAEGTIVRVDSAVYSFGVTKYPVTVRFKTQDGREITTVDPTEMSVDGVFALRMRTPVPVTVYYNPSNPEQVRIDWSTAAAAPAVTYPAESAQSPADPNDPAVPKQGVIMAASPTGEIASGQGEMNMRVQVTRPDGTRFQADAVQPVPQKALPYTLPGSVVDVYYAPDNEEHITVSFPQHERLAKALAELQTVNEMLSGLSQRHDA